MRCVHVCVHVYIRLVALHCTNELSPRTRNMHSSPIAHANLGELTATDNAAERLSSRRSRKRCGLRRGPLQLVDLGAKLPGGGRSEGGGTELGREDGESVDRERQTNLVRRSDKLVHRKHRPSPMHLRLCLCLSGNSPARSCFQSLAEDVIPLRHGIPESNTKSLTHIPGRWTCPEPC